MCNNVVCLFRHGVWLINNSLWPWKLPTLMEYPINQTWLSIVWSASLCPINAGIKKSFIDKTQPPTKPFAIKIDLWSWWLRKSPSMCIRVRRHLYCYTCNTILERTRAGAVRCRAWRWWYLDKCPAQTDRHIFREQPRRSRRRCAACEIVEPGPTFKKRSARTIRRFIVDLHRSFWIDLDLFGLPRKLQLRVCLAKI